MNHAPTLTSASRVARRADQVFGEIDGQIVLLRIESGEYRIANPVASRVWTMIEKPVPVSAVVGTLLAEFEVSAAQCEREVLSFLNELARDSLLVIEET